MCTVVQKDVLIELLANARATVNFRVDPEAERNTDQIYLGSLRNTIYNTHHNQLDFNELSTKIIAIKDKYSHLPINEMYL